MPRHNTAPPAITFKWPNDVLCEGKKVCGILPELAADPDKRNWIVLGIGINLIEVDVPGALYPVGSLSESHVDTRPAHALTLLGRSLSAWLDTWRTDGFGAMQTVEQVVEVAMKALDKKTPPPSVVSGGINYLMATSGRLISRKTLISVARAMFKPKED